MVSMWMCPNCFEVMRGANRIPQGGGWRWVDPTVSTRPMHTCPDDTEHWGVIKTQEQLDNELKQQVHLAKECLADLNTIWDAMFPDEPDGWEYRAQIVREAAGHIKQARHIENLIFTTPGLADAILQDAGYDPQEVGARMAARIKEIIEEVQE